MGDPQKLTGNENSEAGARMQDDVGTQTDTWPKVGESEKKDSSVKEDLACDPDGRSQPSKETREQSRQREEGVRAVSTMN